MSNILERVLDGSLKTKSSWMDVNGIHPAVVVEVVTDHWAWSFAVFVVGVIGLVASLNGMF
jgi:hypothetical protein